MRGTSTEGRPVAAPTVDADPDLPLVQAIADGDGGACRTLVDRHLARLHALATRMTGSSADADEICQDAFLRAWQQAARWQPGQARFSTWLHQVALNLCRDRLRTRRDAAPAPEEAEPAHTDTPEAQAGERERQRQLKAALAALPERQCEALLLCHYQGYSNIEAAGLMEIGVDALESLLARARRGLRAALAARHGNQGEGLA